MRGLAFPPTQDADRETSYEYGTPFSNVDDIPIDPALVSTPIDPVFIMQEPMVTVEQVCYGRFVSATRRVVSI